MKKKDYKIISFPEQENNQKNKKDFVTIFSSIGGIAGLISAIVAIIAIIVNIQLDKKAEVQYKPVIDISIKYYEDTFYKDIYLNETGKYISEIIINNKGGNAEEINISIEPFFNIIYYSQSRGALIKQLLPISDLTGIASYAPLNIDNMNGNNICKISLNENTYNIVKNINTLFEDIEIDYNDYFSNTLPDTIITSIDFEFYITIDYMDIYGNEYVEVYLCETGFRDYSLYLTDFSNKYDEKRMDENVLKYNLDCVIHYNALKSKYLQNVVFDAKISKIPEDDSFYLIYHNFYSQLSKIQGALMYVPNFLENLDTLISYAYEYKQLLFFIDDEKEEWYMYYK